MATTLRSLPEEAERDDWSLSTNAGPINVRDYLGDCTDDELDAGVNVHEDRGRIRIVEIGADGYEKGGDALLTGHSAHYRSLCQFRSCDRPAVIVRSLVSEEPYGLCAAHASEDAAILDLSDDTRSQSDVPIGA